MNHDTPIHCFILLHAFHNTCQAENGLDIFYDLFFAL